ncbi:hypothetical protein [Cellulomonas fengjieae]|uniref:Uncharacterized protein n=1 Tax=Cellulomonas fengjieae TaxID=2819978 RepID=A0ABS3SGI1_9CELL|nr:hypothetical protein [Cellulomonas fengjieae]MBO3084867.1 hypothetical protein [Cellulomonas fengjieae]MBO3103832.1 hypothetical protein [Cellulomonas fengjieae]QVI66819.1 hypothetical protein KG102_04320 [Cellulomonas fengjieae]
MATVLTVGSQLACAHGGSVTLTGGRTALTVGGRAALARLDVLGATISGCGTPATSSTKPCLAVTSLLAGEATKLSVGGHKVLTTDARGLTDGVSADGPGQWSVRSAGHSSLVTS